MSGPKIIARASRGVKTTPVWRINLAPDGGPPTNSAMLSFRSSILATLTVALACTPPATVRPSGDSRSLLAAQHVTGIANEYLAAWREAFPEANTRNGIPGARHDRLNDNSAAVQRAWEAKEDRWLTEMRQIDPASLIGRPEWVTYGLLREALEANIGMRACNFRV